MSQLNCRTVTMRSVSVRELAVVAIVSWETTFFTALLQCVSHIKYTELYDYHRNLIGEFLVLQKETCALQLSFPLFLPRQPLICFLSLWVCLLWTFYGQWAHTIHGLLSLASFTQENVFKVPSCCSMFSTSFLLITE